MKLQKKYKNMKVALLYNVRHIYPDPNDPRSHKEADFDDRETIDAIVENLKVLGHDVLPIEANEEAYQILYENKNSIDIAFNYSLGINSKDRTAIFPAIFDLLKIPYTGSGVLTNALILNKAKAKDVMKSHGIPVLPHHLFKNGDDVKAELKFPLIVKPIAQGSSAGITNDSVVENESELRRQINFINSTFGDYALVETFIQGREFSVPMLGNPPEILPIIESDHSKLPKGYRKLDSMEVKWVFEEQSEENNLICPAKLDSIENKIKNIAIKVWDALGIKDLCRIDIRCDQNGKPFVLEVNSPPGLIPPEVSKTSYFPFSAKVAGIAYPQLLQKIIDTAQKRYQ
ncbi:MAG: D-alanine-D-alanine ligase [Candidatus Woesebacteria bacterium GW2011_GWA1_39_21]|uniref:D-alanine-D-alanine ligase n=1 Tax=Candidatus Woesebacteria bacterium GW2011_GWA1_39_21 TaxID=1618550 RepID=A0A0G0N1R1_9BACT|nr:MAG: D-alanine-D-alanine ligase [Candidatus Woesebacteria bacterium GW2011_GWA1_39_21]